MYIDHWVYEVSLSAKTTSSSLALTLTSSCCRLGLQIKNGVLNFGQKLLFITSFKLIKLSCENIGSLYTLFILFLLHYFFKLYVVRLTILYFLFYF